jgi:hypothetical protein
MQVITDAVLGVEDVKHRMPVLFEWNLPVYMYIHLNQGRVILRAYTRIYAGRFVAACRLPEK